MDSMCRPCRLSNFVSNPYCAMCKFLARSDKRTQRQVELDRQITAELNRETAELIRDGLAKSF